MFKEYREKILTIGLILLGFVKFVLGYLLFPNFIRKVDTLIKQRR